MTVDLSATPQPAVRWTGITQAVCLVALTCVCYWPSLGGGFLWDDDLWLTHSPLVGSWRGLWQIWFSTVPYDYFPLTYTAFWTQWHLWGADPLGYRVVNLALHLASAGLFWRLLTVLRLPGAWFGALLFAIHPLNVASVAWVAELKNTLSMAFYLGALICYVRSEDEPRAFGGRYWAAFALFVLAVLSKSSVVMLPCVLLIFAWWRRGRVDGHDVRRGTPFFAVSLAGGLLTIWFQHHRTISQEHLQGLTHPLPERLLLAGRAVCFYLGKTVWPSPLAMLYPRWTVSAHTLADYGWPLLAAALLAGAWLGRRHWGRAPLAALGYFVLTLLPVSGLVPMSFFTFSPVSDHLIYLSVPGLLALAAAWLGAGHARGGHTRHLALAAMMATVSLLGLACWQRAEEFSSSERLWTATLAVNPDSAAAHNSLGVCCEERGRLPLAEAHFRAALRAEPGMVLAGTNLASLLGREGRWTESAGAYRRVLEHAPDPVSYSNYGAALLETGELAPARAALQRAVELAPTLAPAHFNLYRAALAEHDLPAADGHLRACLRLDPDDVQALCALAALRLEQPGLSAPAAGNIVALAERACRLTGNADAASLALLSKAYAAAERRAESLAVGRRALELAVRSHQTELIAGLGEHLKALQP